MASAGLWLPRRERLWRAHQPRHRRECRGELVQIDGCDHEWFEGRGPRCALLVFVDDATGDLMELRFARCESAFDLRHDPDGPAVGAHAAHLSRGVACAECHLVPARTTAPGHLTRLDGSPDPDGRADLTFSLRAMAGGLSGFSFASSDVRTRQWGRR